MHTRYSAIAKARENVISDAISDSSNSIKKTPPTFGKVVQPVTQQQVVPEVKGQRSPPHVRPPSQPTATVTVTLKDLPMNKVSDVMMM